MGECANYSFWSFLPSSTTKIHSTTRYLLAYNLDLVTHKKNRGSRF